MNVIADYLRKQRFLVLDGALATELERHGADLDDPLWSARCLLENPGLISRVHRDYLEAGADIIASATYQASEAGFTSRGLSAAKARGAMKNGIELAVHARDDFWRQESNRAGRLKPLVAASMGPFGASLGDGSEYHGNYAANWDEVRRFHRERVATLSESAADLLAFETIPSLHEAEIVLDVLSGYPEKRAWISFSCRDEEHVCHGEKLAQAMTMTETHPGIVATGINCTPPRLITPLLRSVQGTKLPIIVYPNSGETWVAREHCWIGETEGHFAPGEWYQHGALIQGGCCRTGPADIARLRQKLADQVTGG